MKSIFNNSMFGFLNPHKQQLSERLTYLKDLNPILNDEIENIDKAEAENYSRLVEVEINSKILLKKFEACYAKSFPLNLAAQQEFEALRHSYIESVNDFLEQLDYHLNSEKKPPTGLIAINICRILQVLSIVFLISLESKVVVVHDLWALCYRLYKRAEILDILSLQINIEHKIFSITALFKQLLIFHSLEIQDLSPENKKIVFFSLIRLVNLLSVKNCSELTHGDAVLVFDLDKENPPFRVEYSKLELCEHIRYIKIADIISIVQRLLLDASANNQLFSDNYALFFPLFNALEQQKKPQRNFTRIESDHDCRVLLGLDNIVGFLTEYEANTKESDKLTKKPAYSIIEQTHIINSTLNGYGLYWESTDDPKPKVGDIIGILPHFHKTLRLEIGFVRRMTPSNENMIFGIELICLGSSLINIEREDEPNSHKQVILLYGSPNYKLGILCDKLQNYKSGDYLSVIRENKKLNCQLGKTVNSNELIKQMELLTDDIE